MYIWVVRPVQVLEPVQVVKPVWVRWICLGHRTYPDRQARQTRPGCRDRPCRRIGPSHMGSSRLLGPLDQFRSSGTSKSLKNLIIYFKK